MEPSYFPSDYGLVSNMLLGLANVLKERATENQFDPRQKTLDSWLTRDSRASSCHRITEFFNKDSQNRSRCSSSISTNGSSSSISTNGSSFRKSTGSSCPSSKSTNGSSFRKSTDGSCFSRKSNDSSSFSKEKQSEKLLATSSISITENSAESLPLNSIKDAVNSLPTEVSSPLASATLSNHEHLDAISEPSVSNGNNVDGEMVILPEESISIESGASFTVEPANISHFDGMVLEVAASSEGECIGISTSLAQNESEVAVQIPIENISIESDSFSDQKSCDVAENHTTLNDKLLNEVNTTKTGNVGHNRERSEDVEVSIDLPKEHTGETHGLVKKRSIRLCSHLTRTSDRSLNPATASSVSSEEEPILNISAGKAIDKANAVKKGRKVKNKCNILGQMEGISSSVAIKMNVGESFVSPENVNPKSQQQQKTALSCDNPTLIELQEQHVNKGICLNHEQEDSMKDIDEDLIYPEIVIPKSEPYLEDIVSLNSGLQMMVETRDENASLIKIAEKVFLKNIYENHEQEDSMKEDEALIFPEAVISPKSKQTTAGTQNKKSNRIKISQKDVAKKGSCANHEQKDPKKTSIKRKRSNGSCSSTKQNADIEQQSESIEKDKQADVASDGSCGTGRVLRKSSKTHFIPICSPEAACAVSSAHCGPGDEFATLVLIRPQVRRNKISATHNSQSKVMLNRANNASKDAATVTLVEDTKSEQVSKDSVIDLSDSAEDSEPYRCPTPIAFRLRNRRRNKEPALPSKSLSEAKKSTVQKLPELKVEEIEEDICSCISDSDGPDSLTSSTAPPPSLPCSIIDQFNHAKKDCVVLLDDIFNGNKGKPPGLFSQLHIDGSIQLSPGRNDVTPTVSNISSPDAMKQVEKSPHCSPKQSNEVLSTAPILDYSKLRKAGKNVCNENSEISAKKDDSLLTSSNVVTSSPSCKELEKDKAGDVHNENIHFSSEQNYTNVTFSEVVTSPCKQLNGEKVENGHNESTELFPKHDSVTFSEALGLSPSSSNKFNKKKTENVPNKSAELSPKQNNSNVTFSEAVTLSPPSSKKLKKKKTEIVHNVGDELSPKHDSVTSSDALGLSPPSSKKLKQKKIENVHIESDEASPKHDIVTFSEAHELSPPSKKLKKKMTKNTLDESAKLNNSNVILSEAVALSSPSSKKLKRKITKNVHHEGAELSTKQNHGNVTFSEAIALSPPSSKKLKKKKTENVSNESTVLSHKQNHSNVTFSEAIALPSLSSKKLKKKKTENVPNESAELSSKQTNSGVMLSEVVTPSSKQLEMAKNAHNDGTKLSPEQSNLDSRLNDGLPASSHPKHLKKKVENKKNVDLQCSPRHSGDIPTVSVHKQSTKQAKNVQVKSNKLPQKQNNKATLSNTKEPSLKQHIISAKHVKCILQNKLSKASRTRNKHSKKNTDNGIEPSIKTSTNLNDPLLTSPKSNKSLLNNCLPLADESASLGKSTFQESTQCNGKDFKLKLQQFLESPETQQKIAQAKENGSNPGWVFIKRHISDDGTIIEPSLFLLKSRAFQYLKNKWGKS